MAHREARIASPKTSSATNVRISPQSYAASCAIIPVTRSRVALSLASRRPSHFVFRRRSSSAPRPASIAPSTSRIAESSAGTGDADDEIAYAHVGPFHLGPGCNASQRATAAPTRCRHLRVGNGLAAVQCRWSRVVTRGPEDRSRIGRCGSIEESQSDCRAAQRDRPGSLAAPARKASRACLYLPWQTAWVGQHEGMEECFEACRHRELPLVRFAAYLGIVASAIRYADARAAAAGGLEILGDGRALCASRA